jgi:putative heme-binding domain-containing protein
MLYDWRTVMMRAMLPFLCAFALAAQDQPEIPEKNPFSSAADAEAGRKYFMGHCAICHGDAGEGGRGVNLTTGRYRHGGSERELFRTIQKGVEGTEMPGAPLQHHEVWKLVAFVKKLGAAGAEEKAAGDREAGRAVYEKAKCAQCHSVNGRGGALGPELGEIGLRRSLAFLRESLVRPAAHIDRRYRTATISPGAITGVVLNEDDYSIQLRETNGNMRSWPKASLKQIRREKGSSMPAYSNLPPADLDDLIAYLNSLRGKP